MRELYLNIPEDSSEPFYLRLARAIRQKIVEGDPAPGKLIPSCRQLARQCGCHRHTVLNALGELVAEGFLVAEPGRGYRVVRDLPSDYLKSRFEVEAPPQAAELELGWKSVYDGWDSSPAPAAFPSGRPDLKLFPREEFFRCLRQVLRESPPDRLLGYGEPAGSPRLRDSLFDYLRGLRGLERGKLLVTQGSREATFLAARALLNRGETVLVEGFGYPPAWEVMRLAGARLAPVKVDEGGLCPEHLEWQILEHKPRMLYLTPLHQYPTTVTLGAARRERIYELCCRNSVAILEDDYDHEFHYRSQPLAPFKAQDPAGIVFYASTFSKLVYPASRIGFLVVAERYYERIRQMKSVLSHQNDPLLGEAMAVWMESGGLARHLRRMRRIYQARRDTLVDALKDRFEFAIPDGGMSLWVDMGCDSKLVSEAVREAGLWIRPGADYRFDGLSSNFLRLGFSSVTAEDITSRAKLLYEVSRACH